LQRTQIAFGGCWGAAELALFGETTQRQCSLLPIAALDGCWGAVELGLFGKTQQRQLKNIAPFCQLQQTLSPTF